ncbi:PREDICTED: uncharacterized protein LOC109243412 [Nicotiana attenuata]|uniref:uncharacterized protein LOC109243412 n=1 Tax=Nicotiana attenuata TaxID=49451 RepID=UPI000904A9C3|nr:PREDICTED: uncharacterized protein LOC109243412 [Nicotiana attenuata]
MKEMPSSHCSTGELPQKYPPNVDSEQPKPSIEQPPSDLFHHPYTTQLHAGVMDGDGPARPLSNPTHDGGSSTHLHHNSTPPLFGTTSNPPTTSRFVQLWTLAMAIHTSPSPVHEFLTTPLGRGAQLPHGPAMPNNAFLPSDGSEQSPPITSLHIVAPSEPTHSHNSEPTKYPSRKQECSYGPVNKGEEPNPGLSKRI